MSGHKSPVTAADLNLIETALASHIEGLEAFLSDADPGDEVEVVKAERDAAYELVQRIRGANQP